VKIAHTCIQIAYTPRKDNRDVIPIFFPVGSFIKSLRRRKLRIEDLKIVITIYILLFIYFHFFITKYGYIPIFFVNIKKRISHMVERFCSVIII
jgi:hypothetical protein